MGDDGHGLASNAGGTGAAHGPVRRGRAAVALGIAILTSGLVVARLLFGWIPAPVELVENTEPDPSAQQISLWITHPQCPDSYTRGNGPVRVDVEETATEVRISAEVERMWIALGCSDSLVYTNATADLRAPLGDRDLELMQP